LPISSESISRYSASRPITVCVFTVTMLLAYDLSYYLYHVGQHKIQLLWSCTKSITPRRSGRDHQGPRASARRIDEPDLGRLHPRYLLRPLDGDFAHPVEVTIFGINVYVMRNLLMMDFVRHTHIRMSFGVLNHIVLCPIGIRCITASIPSISTRTSAGFSFWDRFFGTLYVPPQG